MPKTACILAATLIAAASACAAHGPFTAPLAVADTSGLPEAYTLHTPPAIKTIRFPAMTQWALRDTIELRYVVDTSGSTDPRTFVVRRGHDPRYIDVLKDHIRAMRYTAGKDQDGRPVRAWMTVRMTPRPDVAEGGMNFNIIYQ